MNSPEITHDSAQYVSDIIFDSALRFCREGGYEQNIMLLSFFWSGLLFSVQDEFSKVCSVDDVTACYTNSVGKIYPASSDREKAVKMQQRYWKNLTSDFLSLKAEDEVVAFLLVADKLNSLNKTEGGSATAPQAQKVFLKLSAETISVIKGILFRTESIINAPTRGMAWYKFLIYFALIASAIYNVISGIGYISGTVYLIESDGMVSAQQVYAIFGNSLQVLDMIFGFTMIAYGMFALVVREALADYKPHAPKLVYVFYSLLLVIPILYALAATIITGQSLISFGIAPSIVNLIFLIANVIYFSKRAHLFVGIPLPKAHITPSSALDISNIQDIPLSEITNQSAPVASSQKAAKAEKKASASTNTTMEMQKILFCRKCGAKLSDGSIYCHKCGTKAEDRKQ